MTSTPLVEKPTETKPGPSCSKLRWITLSTGLHLLNAYPLDRDLSVVQRYSKFKKPLVCLNRAAREFKDHKAKEYFL